MKYSHRFFLYAPVAAVVALALAVSAYWAVSAQAFSKQLDALNGHQVAPGVTFRFASKSIGGFPFRVDAVLENMRVDVASTDGPAQWTAEHFALHMLDYGHLQLVLEAAGKQMLRWHDDRHIAHGLSFTPALLRASADLRGGALDRFDLELYGAVTAPLSVAHTELHMRRAPGVDALDIAFMADKVELGSSLKTALGNVISRLRLKARVSPAGPWHALLAGKRDWRKAAEAWRKQKGGVDLADLDIAWGKTEATGGGLLTIDSAHRPKGLIKLKLSGYQVLAKEAARRHLVRGAQEGVLAGLMAEAARNAHEPGGELPVALAFKDGLAYVNGAPVGFLDTLY